MKSPIDSAWAAAWADFLANRVAIAERRAAGRLHLLAPAIEDGSDADLLVTLADLAHMAGAARADSALLTKAVAAYDAHLLLDPDNLAARRCSRSTSLAAHTHAWAAALLAACSGRRPQLSSSAAG